MCEQDVSESEVALNGLVSVPSESSKQLPSEVSDELASIQDAGIEKVSLNLTLHNSCKNKNMVTCLKVGD